MILSDQASLQIDLLRAQAGKKKPWQQSAQRPLKATTPIKSHCTTATSPFATRSQACKQADAQQSLHRSARQVLASTLAGNV